MIRVKQGGEVTERIKVETDAFACMLGGPDGRTLFVRRRRIPIPRMSRDARRENRDHASRSATRRIAVKATGASDGRMA